MMVHGGQRIPIDGGISIGRRSENTVVINNELVSRAHVRICAGESGYYVADLGSKNGTYLNGERFHGESRWLRNGDTVAVGGAALRFLDGRSTAFAPKQSRLNGVQHVRFDGRGLKLGRDVTNDLLLDDPNVSRFHAEVNATDRGLEVRDLGSRNGTRVDGQLVERATLTAGSQIGIGPFNLVFDGTDFLARNDRGALRLDATDASLVIKGKRILAPTTISVKPGELVAIIGESGSGKSSLMKLLAGVTRPSEGVVTVNGEPVRARLTDVGYVPQDEIVHARLTVREALSYAARLRLPDDARPAEIEATVDRALDALELRDHADTRIDVLSGGQRKRAGVATELLNRPGLLLLDEPTTGLDPGLESKLMRLLRDLANQGRGVAVVTHATKNLALVDQLIVMGRGGDLAFVGAPTEALRFFGVADYDDVYTALERRPAREWRALFEETSAGQPPTPPVHADSRRPANGRGQPGRSVVSQAKVLIRRYVRVMSRDRRNLLLILGQVPLLALGMIGLFDADVFSGNGSETAKATQLLFLLATTIIWIGSIDAAREIIKERGVLAREKAVGVRTGAYLLSKTVVLFSLVALQATALAVIVLSVRPLYEPVGTYAETLILLVFTGFAAVALGLLISALVRSQDQATSFIPLLLIPQLFFAGAIVQVKQMGDAVAAFSKVVFAQWSYAALGTSVDMNSRIAGDRRLKKMMTDYGDAFFDVELLPACLLLGAFASVFLLGSAVLIHRRA